MTKQHDLSGGSSSSNQGQGPSGSSGQGHIRPRTVSSPIPYVSPNSSRPLSPGKAPPPPKKNNNNNCVSGNESEHFM